MKVSTRQRALRTLLAAFMNSSLTPQELQELSDDISQSPKFTADLRSLLSSVAMQLREESPQKSSRPPDDLPVSQALSIIKRLRLSKSEVLKAIDRATPNLGSRFADDAKMREILLDYFSHASEDQRAKFLTLISPKGSETTEDPYLRGIVGDR